MIHSKLKSWWCPLTILDTTLKVLNLYDNILEFKIHFELKLILIQWLDEKHR
jgi:hypothetical protein